MNTKQTEALKLAREWYDSGNENPDDFADMIKQVIALAEQPAQQPYDTHAAPGQSFDTHGRTPPAQNELAYQYLLAEIRHMTAELAKFRAVSAQALEALESMENSRDDTAIQRAITDLREALAERPAQQDQDQDQGQSCYCPNCEALSKELAALKAQQQEPVARVVAFCKSAGSGPKIDWMVGASVAIGDFLYTSPPASKPWVGLDDTDLAVCDTDGVQLARYWERVLREKNA